MMARGLSLTSVVAELDGQGPLGVVWDDATLRLMERHGCEQAGREVPVGWRRRRLRSPGRCYEAAGRWSGRDGIIYTEGMARSPWGHWIAHAWLTDSAGGVIDLAWSEPSSHYFGVEIDAVAHARAAGHLGMWEPVLPTLAAWGWEPDTGGDA
jgi:hypothetical protein